MKLSPLSGLMAGFPAATLGFFPGPLAAQPPEEIQHMLSFYDASPTVDSPLRPCLEVRYSSQEADQPLGALALTTPPAFYHLREPLESLASRFAVVGEEGPVEKPPGTFVLAGPEQQIVTLVWIDVTKLILPDDATIHLGEDGGGGGRPFHHLSGGGSPWMEGMVRGFRKKFQPELEMILTRKDVKRKT